MNDNILRMQILNIKGQWKLHKEPLKIFKWAKSVSIFMPFDITGH